MQNIRAEIETHWQTHMDDHPLWREWAESAGDVFGAVSEALRAPGKRLRPTLFCLACRAFGFDPIPQMLPAAMALELVHNFILIHDDLMDGSELRRGEPTLARRMALLLREGVSGGFSGNDMAMVAGDMLYTMAMDSLMGTESDAERIVAAMRACMKSAMDTGRGALLEAKAAQADMGELKLDWIEMVYALKTGSYTFSLPAKLASIFAPAKADFPFDEFGKHAGVAYQLKNDRASMSHWLGGGAVPDDVRDQRRTWAAVWAWHAVAEERRELFVGSPGEDLKRLYRDCGAMDAMAAAARLHATTAMELAPSEEIAGYLAEALAV